MNYVIIIILLFTISTFSQTQSLEKETIYITVEDTIKLATDIYFPQNVNPNDGKRYNTVLVRTPYSKEAYINGEELEIKAFLKNNFVVIIQDTRGKFSSEGEFYPFVNERKDGLITINWIRSQSWSNGKIVGWGSSYVGYTQWAIADQLEVIAPGATTANLYDLFHPEGNLSLATLFNWGFGVVSKTWKNIEHDMLMKSYSILPLINADNVTDKQNEFTDDCLLHLNYDGYWKMLDRRKKYSMPVLAGAGWYDIFLLGQIRDFESLREKRHPSSRLIIGPYAHGEITIGNKFEQQYDEIKEFYGEWIDFMAKYLNGEVSGNTWKSTYSFFIINRNEWVNCNQWPPKNSEVTHWYLLANGEIDIKPDKNEKVLEYTYNPADPYPSIGGTFLGVGVGPAYQNPNESRKDQLMFESEVLEKPLVLLGEINATVFASTDVPSTSFFVQLQEQRHDGKIINIQEGGKTIYSDDNVVTKVEKVDISLWATGYQIEAGSKIRVAITSSLFPRYNRNLNSGENIFDAKNIKIANQKIYFGKNYPTHIQLPVYEIK